MRLSFATGMALSRDTALALAQKYHEPSSAARTFALAFAHAQSALRHLGITSEDALLYERLASRVLYADRSLRAGPEILARSEFGQEGLWPHGISGDLPILLVRVVEEDDLPLVREVLQAQEYWRLKGLRADVVILNEHPVSYLDEMHGQLTALLDNGPWRAWNHQLGGAYLLRGDRMGEAERVLLAAVARAVLSGDRGDLSAQLEHAYAYWPEPEPADLVPSRPPEPAAASDGDLEVPPLALANGLGGFARRRARLRGAGRGTDGDTAAVGERDRQSRVRDRRHRLRVRLHLGREQPREPPHAVRERPRQRSDRRGAVRPRRRDGRSVVADAGPDPPHGDEPAPGPALGRPHPLLASRARHPSRARRLRGRERSREDLAARPDERERPHSSPQRLRLQRVDPGSATRGPAAPRRDRARRRDRRGLRPQPLQHRVPRTRGLRPRERGLALGYRRPGVVPGPQRVARAPGRARPRGALRPLRRGPRSLLSAARVDLAGRRRDARPPVPAGPGPRTPPRPASSSRATAPRRRPRPRSAPCVRRGTARSTRCR